MEVLTVAEQQVRKLPLSHKQKKSYDNTHFSIVGNITNCYDDDDCTFRDSTGTIHIDVEDGAWGGQNVNPNTRVRISGKVDHDDGRTKLDVYRITVL